MKLLDKIKGTIKSILSDWLNKKIFGTFIDNKYLAKKYVDREVSERFQNPHNDGAAHQWIADQIMYYQNPEYPHCDYTKEVLKYLED